MFITKSNRHLIRNANLRCKVCGKKLELVDEDYDFPGCSNIYWECEDEHCGGYAREKIRYKNSCKTVFYNTDGIELK